MIRPNKTEILSAAVLCATLLLLLPGCGKETGVAAGGAQAAVGVGRPPADSSNAGLFTHDEPMDRPHRFFRVRLAP